LKNRVYILDDLRGIAIICVIIYHYSLYSNNISDTVVEFSKNFRDLFNLGSFAVSLFFLISGFVIALSLNKDEKIKTVKEFIIKRFFRLYPTYWLSIIAILLVTYLFNLKYKFTLKEIFFNFTMFQDMFHIKNIDGVYWTLAIEIKFYILSAIFYMLNFLKKIRYIFAIFFFLALFTLFLSYFDGKRGFYNLTISYLFLMYLGTAFFYNYQKVLSKKELYTMIVLTIFYFILYAFLGQDRGEGELFGYGISTIFAIILFFITINFKSNISSITTFFGEISYSLYLFHQLLGYIFIDYLLSLNISLNISKLTAFFSATLLAYIINTLIEKPTNRFGHQLAKKIA